MAVTTLLRAWSDGDESALERLMPLVEAECRSLARKYMSPERRQHALQPTASVNKSFLRLIDAQHIRWQDRGGDACRVTLNEGLVAMPEPYLAKLRLSRELSGDRS